MEQTCKICNEKFDDDVELFEKHRNDVCSNCDKELFEDEIGYDA